MVKIKNCFTIIFIILSVLSYSQDIGSIERKDIFGISGQVSAGGFIYSHDGLDARQQKNGYSLSASLNTSIYGIDIPLFVSWNEQGGSFQNPFNRFGISPKYKWAQVHLGWRYMNFSQFTMQGISFYGAGIELKPGKWRLAGMYGRFQKATNGNDVNYFGPRFERKGWSAKIGYGSNRTFMDLILFKAEDDLLTLSDTIDANAYENLSIGLKGKISLYKDYAGLFFDAGVSAFTEDLRADTFPEKIREYTEKYSKLYDPNISSHFNYAGEAGIFLKFGEFNINGKYRRVMPEYKTLGINYLLNDLEAFTVNPSLRIMKNKITISGSAGIERNNLDGLRQNQNNRWIGSAMLDIHTNPYWGLNVQYNNYTFDQRVVNDTLFQDSLLLNQSNQNFVIVPRYTIVGTEWIQNIILNINYQILRNKTDSEFTTGDGEISLINANYSLSKRGGNTRFNLGTNWFKYRSEFIGIERLGLSGGITQQLLKKRVSIKTNVGYQQSLNTKDNSLYVSLGGRYSITNNLKLSINARIVSRVHKGKKRMESRSELRLSQRF